MSYCSVADVLAAAPKLTVDADTDPSTATVERWCAERTADVNGRLNAAGITVPDVSADDFSWDADDQGVITDWPAALPGAQSILRSITVDGVIADIFEHLNVDDSDEEASSYRNRYYRRLEGIAANPRRILRRARPGIRVGKVASTVQRYDGVIW